MSIKWQSLTSTANVNQSLFDASSVLSFGGTKLHPNAGYPGSLTIHEKHNHVEVHPALGVTTPIWGYEGKYPGPTIEVDAGAEVRIRVKNRITGNIPYPHVVADDSIANNPMNDPGINPVSAEDMDQHEAENVLNLNAWTVIHLHGGPTHPDSDGWTDNMIGKGETVEMGYTFNRETYTMEQPSQAPNPTVKIIFKGGAAPMYWYHDHAMGVARFNVYAGLAGAWLVRDPVEHEIGLPTGKYELPLILQDRNFETVDGTSTGDLTGRFLHKVQSSVRECFAPANLVNGKLWPRIKVKKQVYRLRLVNGANARVYRLHFMGLKTALETRREKLPNSYVQQIGTDGGLLGKAVDLPDGSLILSPGERADVLLDFGLAAEAGYKHVVVYNSAAAPFNGDPVKSDADVYTGNPKDFREFPQVMRFDLHGNAVETGLEGRSIEHMVLDTAFKRLPLDHALYPTNHDHSIVVLREEDVAVTDPHTLEIKTRTMLFLHEMMEEQAANNMGMNMHKVQVPAPDGSPLTVNYGIKLKLADDPNTYVSVAKRFNDMTSIFIEKGAWHLWKVINLSPDTHPFHIHLVQFQAIKRKRYPATSAIDPSKFEFTFTENPVDAGIDQNEAGWKDTVRVNPGERDGSDNISSAEMVVVAAQFNKHAGRFMYHCHILEHEDSEMMRPFVVVPKETMPFMGHLKHHI